MCEPGEDPVVSLVVPAYNSEGTVGRTIESVIAQVDPRWELIVVDDGSTDDTVDAANAAAGGDPRVVVMRGQHAGVSNARNRGISAARGRLVGFIDSDDTIAADWVQQLAAPFALDPAVGVVFCAVTLEQQDGTRTVVAPEPLGPLHQNMVGLFLAGSFLIDRRVLTASGTYAQRLAFGENYELGIRVSRVLAAQRRKTVALTRALATIATNPDRAFSRAQARVDYAQYLTQTHAGLVEEHRDVHHSLVRQIAVNSTRVADTATARRAALRGLQIAPRRLSSWSTLAGAMLPALGRARWGSVGAGGAVRRPSRRGRLRRSAHPSVPG